MKKSREEIGLNFLKWQCIEIFLWTKLTEAPHMQPNHKWVRFHEDTFEPKFENLRLREKSLLGRNGLLCDFYVI